MRFPGGATVVRRSRLASLLAAGSLLGAIPGDAAEPVRIALLPVVVHSSEAETEYLSAGLAEMLTARLEQFPQVAVIRLDGRAEPTAEESAAVAAGRGAGAQYVVFGSFTQFGAGASLDVRCARIDGASGEADGRRIFIQSGTTGEIIPRLEELATKIHRYVAGVDRAPARAPRGGEEQAGTEALVEELERRVDALERAVYAPSDDAGAAAGAEGAAGAAAESGGPAVR